MVEKLHHWSGWPGAYCLDCGAQHALEVAIGDGLFDPCTGAWADTPEAMALRMEDAAKCPSDWRPDDCGQCRAFVEKRPLIEGRVA